MTAEELKKKSKAELISELEDCREQIKALKDRDFGLFWEVDELEKLVHQNKTYPVLKQITKNKINSGKNFIDTNILIEGDNYNSLSILKYTHRESIDLIYIDPPYNTGKKDLKYNDSWVDEEHGFIHSRWLEFMNARLEKANHLLKDDGLILIHIDEHEQHLLHALLNDIFPSSGTKNNEKNYLGTIVWNKRNPKGDAQGISFQHEYLIAFTKNRQKFTSKHNLERKKSNAPSIIKKATLLFNSLGKSKIPDELNVIIKKYNLKCNTSSLKIKNDLDSINNEFKSWIKNQNYTEGEKQYKFIDVNGRVFRLASMAWPNKKTAPKKYFTPLIHPKTRKKCPVPARGWRNPPKTMNNLIKKNLIVFGDDHTTQPQLKLFLDENLTENISSIYDYGGSDDEFFKKMNLKLENQNPKPVNVVKSFLESFLPNDGIVLDFFAGTGTTGHAVLELNKEDCGNRKFILCTNNENKICTKICYPRIKNIIKGYTTKEKKPKKIAGLGGNLGYFKIDFVDAKDNQGNIKKLAEASTEILCIKEDCFDLIKKEKDFRAFSNSSRKIMCIIDDYPGIKPCIAYINKIKSKISQDEKINVYEFSFGNTTSQDSFDEAGLDDLVNLISFPDELRRTYDG